MPDATPLPSTGAPATRALAGIGITTLDDLRERGVDALTGLHGIGPTAIRILRAAMQEVAIADRVWVDDGHPQNAEGGDQSGRNQRPSGTAVPAATAPASARNELACPVHGEDRGANNVRDDGNGRAGEPRLLGDKRRAAAQFGETGRAGDNGEKGEASGDEPL